MTGRLGRGDEKSEVRRSETEEGRVYTLAYADNVMLIAEGKDKTKSMIDRLEGYLERKRLELNARKLKIMRFKKGGCRLGKKD